MPDLLATYNAYTNGLFTYLDLPFSSLFSNSLTSSLASTEPIALGIFLAYFGTILGLFYLVWRSLSHGVKMEDLFSGRAFLFLRIAVGALGCTWYFMIEYMKWSFRNYASRHPGATIGKWLTDTALFEEAWTIVCSSKERWWWSCWICVWSVVLTAIVYRESPRRGIRYPWAYLLLGMFVAISVATALYITALFLHPPRPNRGGKFQSLPLVLYPWLFLALVATHRIPSVVGTSQFLPTLLWLHLFVLIPFIPFRTLFTGKLGSSTSDETSESEPLSTVDHDQTLYRTLFLPAFLFFILNTTAIQPPHQPTPNLLAHAFSHPAQASISMDVLWSAGTAGLWYLLTGSIGFIAFKWSVLAAWAILGTVMKYGVNWTVILSVIPILSLLSAGIGFLAIARMRSRNAEKRKDLLERLGIKENEVVPGTKGKAPTMAGKKVIIGFWHPYCNAGGGGERVLWSAIAYIQRTQQETVCLVYSGDYPAASKEAILSKANDRFSIHINPKLVVFVPLPSRYLISDTYWTRFTLLGQSLGSIWLAWQGISGKEGLWGDVFIDTMGHAFTYPFVRLIGGGEMIIAAYTHYPTVSADMVRRIKAGEMGIESGSTSSGGLRKRAKLLYYHIFTTLYSTSLLFASCIMTNSTWTQNHIQTLLSSGRNSLLASVLLMDETTEKKARDRGDKVEGRVCQVVYPPCDTRSLIKSNLGNRARGIVSLAQFRPEKDQAKQLYALAELFEAHPEYKTGKDKVVLTLMGGVRDESDQSRLEALNALSTELGLQDNVEFIVSAPYSDIVKRLGEASIGLNTMQDEHFGINVVEFMAAGLIPIVHDSAGPKMDIVTPYNGRQTGYHAKTPKEFAEAIHTALSLPDSEQRKIREAARNQAKVKFSQEKFEKGWEGVWKVIQGQIEDRRGT